jgi:hypothetical protein
VAHDFEPLSGRIIEAAIHVHKQLGLLMNFPAPTLVVKRVVL